jgi:hypothetical protein
MTLTLPAPLPGIWADDALGSDTARSADTSVRQSSADGSRAPCARAAGAERVGYPVALLPKRKGALMILEEMQHHLDRIEAAQKRCEEQPTDVATIVVLLNTLAMAVKDLLRDLE